MNAAVSLSEVLARPDIWCANRLASTPVPAVSSGFPTLDAELPGGGWPRGTLTEILVDNTGFGECALLMPALGKLGEEERWSLLVAPPHELNAPAWAAWGIDLSRLAIASPTRPRDVCGPQSTPCQAAPSELCCAGQHTLMPLKSDACR